MKKATSIALNVPERGAVVLVTVFGIVVKWHVGVSIPSV